MTGQSKKSICVYCGHKTGNSAAYIDAATALGHGLGQAGHRLIYGGGTSGMMGAVADGVTAHNGAVLGIMPKHLFEKERDQDSAHELILTDTMHERKKIMVMNADAFVLLPGGIGSLDEFFELITWRQLGLHDKPCFILNINGFWSQLEALIAHQIDQGFVPADNRDYFKIFDTVPEVLAAI